MPTRNAPNEEAAWDARRAGRAYVRATVRRTKRAMLWLSIGLAMLGGHQGTQTQAFAADAPDALSAATAHKESAADGGRDAKALNAFENTRNQLAAEVSFDLIDDDMAHDMVYIIRTDLNK